MKKTIHRKDALSILKDQSYLHHLRLWKLKTGDILDYKNVRYIGEHKREGIIRVKFLNGAIRAFRICTLFEIDDLKIYL